MDRLPHLDELARILDTVVAREFQSRSFFLPLTLEMGSWTWVKKNPRQAFSLLGIFNPLIEHRQQRVLRRHLPLLEFLVRAACSHDRWLPRGQARQAHRALGLAHWFPETCEEARP